MRTICLRVFLLFVIIFLPQGICFSQDINPYCYGAIMPPPFGEHKNKEVDISYCNKVAGSKGKKVASGFVVADNKKTNKDRPYSSGTTAVKVLSDTGNDIIAIISQWYGGTGASTNIVRFKKKQDTLIFHKVLAEGGDRCMGGIKDAFFLLSFSKYKTPYGFLELFDKNICGLTYKDLSDCAVCCFGTAHYELKNLEKGRPSLTGFTFTRELPVLESSKDYSRAIESCLAQQIKEMRFVVNRKYSVKELTPLVNNFRSRCLGK